MKRAFGFVSPIQQMSLHELHAARAKHLDSLRRDIVPSKQDILRSIRHYVDGATVGVTLGKTLCERVFYVRDFDVKPRDFHSWAPPRKQEYNKQRNAYIKRFYEVLPTAAYGDLLPHERETLERYRDYTQAWVAHVTDSRRDVEVAYGRPHPAAPDTIAGSVSATDAFEQMVSPTLRSIYDHELLRREQSATLQNDASLLLAADACKQCKTSEYMVPTIENGLVCANCGIVAQNASTIDETSDALPFGTQLSNVNNRNCYEMTENFMKNLDLLEGTHNNKVTEEAKEYVKANVNGRRVTINLIRRILKRGGYQRFYPAASVIYEFVTSEAIEKCTPEQRAQMHRMHVQYVYAFQACPESVRRRKSSLTNNYLTCKFYQMLGLSHRIRYLHMLKCPKKVREHDRVFAWIVEYVRATSERRRVADGTTYWEWCVTPLD